MWVWICVSSLAPAVASLNASTDHCRYCSRSDLRKGRPSLGRSWSVSCRDCPEQNCRVQDVIVEREVIRRNPLNTRICLHSPVTLSELAAVTSSCSVALLPDQHFSRANFNSRCNAIRENPRLPVPTAIAAPPEWIIV